MSLRKILFWIHLVTGCMIGVIVLIMSVTGVLLTYKRQITNWANRDSRSVRPVATSARMPLEAMMAKVIAQNRTMPSAITLHSDPAAPAEVAFGREQLFFVDVYTGNVLGRQSPVVRSFFQTIESWHRQLGANGQHRAVGRAITGACNFGFLLLVLSGPFLWVPRRWSWQHVKPVTLFRRELAGRAREFNWHNVIGIWCAAPLLLIVLSGVIMSYPWANNLLYRLTGNEPPVRNNVQRGARSRNDAAAGPDLSGFGLLWTRAEQQVPGWRSLTLRMPSSGREPVIFTIDAGSGGRPDERSQLTLNPRTGEVIRWEPFSNYDAGRRLRSWFRFLHTGEAGGIACQTVAGVVSTGAAMLVWTGLWLALRRLSGWRRRGFPMATFGMLRRDRGKPPPVAQSR